MLVPRVLDVHSKLIIRVASCGPYTVQTVFHVNDGPRPLQRFSSRRCTYTAVLCQPPKVIQTSAKKGLGQKDPKQERRDHGDHQREIDRVVLHPANLDFFAFHTIFLRYLKTAISISLHG